MVCSTDNVWLHRFACALAFATLFLVGLGGVVTTKGVGMAVPDWPTTYGQNMFLFPPSKWVGGIFYEHSHRLVAAAVGLLTSILAVWLWLKESRRWICWLGTIAFVAVAFQGVLGGMRVVFDKYGLGTELGIFHAVFAQLFFLLTCSIALFTSGWWRQNADGDLNPQLALRVRRAFGVTTLLILMQLVFGATMRHQHAGLAVPDFPLAYGKIWPATDAASVELYNATRLEAAGEQPITAPHIVVHMLHRITGFVVLFAIIGCAVVAWRNTPRRSLLRKISTAWIAVALTQVAFGILSILSQRKVDVTTAHVAVGALTFAMGWTLVLIASRSVTMQRATASETQSVLPQTGELKRMKSGATTIQSVIGNERSAFAIWSDLVKARLTFLVLLTTLAGFYAGVEGAIEWVLLAHTLLGITLVACGAAALNQWWEREHDAKMARTETRPLPANELSPAAVLLAGGIVSIGGLLHLALFVNLLTSLLGAITLLSYVLIYTPLKRITTLNTAIGAIPGALPPLMGWAAARDSVSREGWALFAILFFWQLPHFLAIAWMYRDEYAKAGFVMLPVRDASGVRTGRQAISHTLGLVAVSVCPAILVSNPSGTPIAGRIYFFGALLLGLAFLWCAIQFSRELTRPRARQLFFASIFYLPLLLGLMALDKVRH